MKDKRAALERALDYLIDLPVAPGSEEAVCVMTAQWAVMEALINAFEKEGGMTRLVWNDVHSGHSFVWQEGEIWIIEYDDCGHEAERHNMVTIVRAYIEDLKRGV